MNGDHVIYVALIPVWATCALFVICCVSLISWYTPRCIRSIRIWGFNRSVDFEVHSAARAGELQVLMEHTDRLNEKDPEGKTILSIAVQSGNEQLTSWLIARGVVLQPDILESAKSPEMIK